MSVKITGLDVISRYLKEQATDSDIKQVILQNTSEMQNKAQRKAAVDTGNMRRMIEMDIRDNGFTGIVKASAGYSGYVEWGTRFMTAQPFMRPSFNSQIIQLEKDMKRLMK